MKQMYLFLGIALCGASYSSEGSEEIVESRTPYSVVERGAHHRVWQSIHTITDAAGRETVRTNSYTEISTGLHYEQNGNWVESQELIKIEANGAVATNGQHKVAFANNINSEGALDLTAPDGKRFQSWIAGLSYYDAATGQNVLIAELKDSIGQIVSSNILIYPDAFTDFRADVRYIYTRNGLEQDIILRECPPSPSEYGLDPATTKLQVLTEFFEPPLPEGRRIVRKNGMDIDDVIDFGTMRIGRGKAFRVENQGKNVDVDKLWLELEGRDFLIEEVPVSRLEGMLENLPPAPLVSSNARGVRHVVSRNRMLPKRTVASTKRVDRIQIAQLQNAGPGFVIDYPITLETATNFIFKGDSTYYVSGTVDLAGTTTIEGGTVVKGENSLARINFNGPVICRTEAYRPAVFTSKDDDSVGHVIDDSTGSPWGKYWNTSMQMNVGQQALSYLRIAYATIGVAYDNVGGSNTVSHSQFVDCDTAVKTTLSEVHLKNNLIVDAATALVGEENGRLVAEHLTVHRADYLADDLGSTPWTLALTNSLLVSVTNLGPVAIASDRVQVTNGVSTFEIVGGGGHYLAAGSPYRDAGTTNLSAGLLGEIAKRTTYPPIVYSNVTISSETIFSPQAQRDSDVPDLGYHYDALDYAFGGVDASNNVTFAAGTAAGWFRTSSDWKHAGHGIHLADTKVARFEGRVEAPTYWVRCNTVQEVNTGNWQGGFGPGGITGWADQNLTNATLASEVQGRFLFCSAIAGELGCHFRDDYGYLNVRLSDSEIRGGLLGGYVLSLYLTNCLFDRVAVTQVEGWPGTEVALRNCTFYGGEFQLSPHKSEMPIDVKDSAFDQTLIIIFKNATNQATALFDYNAYTNSTNPFPHGGGNDIQSVTFNWEPGPLGYFYNPVDSPLLDEGSRAANVAGLFHFTTTTNQVKETNSLVDIGFHYVAVDSATGRPWDSDADGLFDYFEDTDGDGVHDTGESDWNDADSDNDGIPDGWEVVLGINPIQNEIQTHAGRLNYDYRPNGWLLEVDGKKQESISLDAEGNILQINP